MINTFPEVIDNLIDTCLRDIKRVRSMHDKAPPSDKDMLSSALGDYTNQLKKLRWHKRVLTNTNKSGSIDGMIDRAKEFPIDSMLDFKKGKALCIWHSDTRPSLSLKGNKVKCFVCGEGGDSIDVYMKLHGAVFADAVRKLGG